MKNIRFRLALAGVATVVALGLAACSADSPTDAARQPSTLSPVQTDTNTTYTTQGDSVGKCGADGGTGGMGSGGRC